MNQLELQKAKELLDKFEELQEEFNSKYESSLDVRIENDGDLNISCDYFNYKNVNQLEQIIIDYKKIWMGYTLLDTNFVDKWTNYLKERNYNYGQY